MIIVLVIVALVVTGAAKGLTYMRKNNETVVQVASVGDLASDYYSPTTNLEANVTSSVSQNITVDKDNTIYSIAVKSGTSVFNDDSRKRQEQNFQAAQKRAQQAHKAFIPVVGYGYGKKRVKPENEKFYKELAGKDFWEWLTGDPEFYTKIIAYMGTKPDEFASRFEDSYNKAQNRMIRDFTIKYCNDDGSIDWEQLIKMNSGD